MSKTVKIIAVIVFAALALLIYKNNPVTGGVSDRSVVGIRDPIQKKSSGKIETTAAGYDVTIKFKYSYDIEALVVHTKNYSGTSMVNKLSPKDLALAWGEAAEKNGDINFHWGQSGRWYHWSVNSEDTAKISIDAISKHSANNHLIPSDDIIRKQIMRIKTGDHIRLEGYLVDVRGEKDDGSWYTWNSSETRNDTGDGACEIIYVTKVEWLD